MKPRIADLFCGAGGAGMGLHRAGFEVVGFDLAPMPRYPFAFHQQDALTVDLSGFDAVWASPPCQDYSRAVRHLSLPQPRLIEPVMAMVSDMPFIIENVVGAPIPHQPTLDGRNGIMLCGTSFGLKVWRHRLFETSYPVEQPACRHKGFAMNPYNAQGSGRTSEPEWRDEMGVSWMRKEEYREAIPPAYSEYLGNKLLKVL